MIKAIRFTVASEKKRYELAFEVCASRDLNHYCSKKARPQTQILFNLEYRLSNVSFLAQEKHWSEHLGRPRPGEP